VRISSDCIVHQASRAEARASALASADALAKASLGAAAGGGTVAAAPTRLRSGGRIEPARGLFERRHRRTAALEQTPVGSRPYDESPPEAWHLWGSGHLSASGVHSRVTSVLPITCLLLAGLCVLSGDA
jgi:hypothetical protein